METRRKIGEWLGNYVVMILAVFIVLTLAAVVAFPIGFLCDVVRKLFLYGYHLW